MIKNFEKIKTLSDLKKSGYVSRSIKEEMRENLIASLRGNKNPFSGIIGYDETVIPDIQSSILSKT